ncbi:MAG TPA: hypothetical protein VGQ11_07900 [Candidatus Acidoferrales bacterium]|jgi:hypothetical protein|nr:hypothetical protein [Candidatus Acidoferrales bacterium]
MRQKSVLGILLIVIGLGVLIFPNIPYKKEENSVDMGPMHVKVEEQKKITVAPVIGGLILAGGIVLVMLGARRSP